MNMQDLAVVVQGHKKTRDQGPGVKVVLLPLSRGPGLLSRAPALLFALLDFSVESRIEIAARGFDRLARGATNSDLVDRRYLQLLPSV